MISKRTACHTVQDNTLHINITQVRSTFEVCIRCRHLFVSSKSQWKGVRSVQPVEAFRKKAVTGGFIWTEQGNTLQILVWGVNQDADACSWRIWSCCTSLHLTLWASRAVHRLQGLIWLTEQHQGSRCGPDWKGIRQLSDCHPSLRHTFPCHDWLQLGLIALRCILATGKSIQSLGSPKRCVETNRPKHGTESSEEMFLEAIICSHDGDH